MKWHFLSAVASAAVIGASAEIARRKTPLSDLSVSIITSLVTLAVLRSQIILPRSEKAYIYDALSVLIAFAATASVQRLSDDQEWSLAASSVLVGVVAASSFVFSRKVLHTKFI